MKKRILRLLALAALAAAIVAAGVLRHQSREGLRFVKQLGNGINLGNSLDVYKLADKGKTLTVEDYETAWHNPPISRTCLRAVKEAGFDLVRIPVSWGEHMDGKGRVDEAWMDRVNEVVRKALKQELYVILDTHHETWLDLNNDEKDMEERLVLLWEQIALRFADCGEKLLFEGMNEPRRWGGALEWSEGTQELRQRVARLNRAFVRAVRAAGGNNETRWLLVATYANRTDEAALKDLKLPDKRCIVSLHLYEPYEFCQKESGPDAWDSKGREAEKLLSAFERIHERLIKRNIPVIITECGCIDKKNESSRVSWVQSLRTGAAKWGVPCIWWDDGGEYRLVDRRNGKILFPRILKAFTDGT